MKEIKDKNGRLFVFLHENKEGQDEFILEATKADCFVQPIPFMTLQAGKDFISNKLYFQNEEVVDENKKKMLKIRPYLTISNANPDAGLPYFNWTYLESIIETGWKFQFASWT